MMSKTVNLRAHIQCCLKKPFKYNLCCFSTDREGLSETAHHLPEQEACSGYRWWQGEQGKAPPLP